MALVDVIEPYQPVLLAYVLASLLVLGAGYLAKGRRAHDLRIIGWIAFGLYWPTQAPHYFHEVNPTNAWFSLAAPLLTGYMAWHEWKSRKWNEDPVALRWMTGTVFITSFTYFIIYKIPWATNLLIQWTTWQSTLVARHVFRIPATYGMDSYGNWNIYINGEEYAVTVILACTALQSMMIFVGAIACIDADRRMKWKALAASVLPIYFLNLVRNAGIVYGYKVLEWNPFRWGPADTGSMFWQYYPTYSEGSFHWMHSVIGKGGSLLFLVFIAVVLFRMLPELHNAILDIFDLRKRNRPGFFDAPPAGGKGAQAAGSGTDTADAAGAK